MSFDRGSKKYQKEEERLRMAFLESDECAAFFTHENEREDNPLVNGLSFLEAGEKYMIEHGSESFRTEHEKLKRDLEEAARDLEKRGLI